MAGPEDVQGGHRRECTSSAARCCRYDDRADAGLGSLDARRWGGRPTESARRHRYAAVRARRSADELRRLPGRDPFSGGSTASSASTSGSGTTTGQTLTTAQLQINGATEDVAVAGTFPKDDPVFKLVSVTANSVLVSLSSGAKFTSGNASEEIKVGETLTVTGDDGSSFSIKLLSTGTN